MVTVFDHSVAESLFGQEYLISKSTRAKHPMHHINSQTAHTQVALLCMCYIRIYLQRSGTRDLPPRDSLRTSIPRNNSNWTASHPKKRYRCLMPSEFHLLFEYALSCGFGHLAYVNPRNKAILRALRGLQSDAERYPLQWKQLYDGVCTDLTPRPDPEDDLALSILIASAPDALLRLYISSTRWRPKDGTNPLIYAVSHKKIEHAKSLLLRGVDVNRRGWVARGHQFLPLEIAVGHGDRDMVDLFLHSGSCVPRELFAGVFTEGHLTHARTFSRLLQTDEFAEWAIEVQDEELLLRALDQKRYFTFDGGLAEQDIDVIERRLIQIGSKPPPRSDEASIRYAVSQGHVATVKDMLAKDTTFPPDIILDACRERSNPTMIRLSLDMGGGVKVTSPNGDTPIHLVLDAQGSEDDCLECVQALIDAGCDPAAHNLVGDTPIHIAVRRGHLAVVEYLLSLHVPLPPNILLVTSTSRDSEVVAMVRNLLVREGAGVRVIAANGDTTLHIAAGETWGTWDEHLEKARILIDAGCNPCVPNASGETALDVAAERGHFPLVRYLLSKNVRLQPGTLLSLLRSSRPQTPMIKILVDHGADPHVTDSYGNTLLHLALTARVGYSEQECLETMKFLVGVGCNPCACESRGRTPFYFAARLGYVSIMEYLLSLGASIPPDIMLSQFKRNTFPVPQRHQLATRFLLDKGGDIHTISPHGGDTLLHLAAKLFPEHDALEFSQLFVDAGCNPLLLNSDHETPLHIAAWNGHISVIDYYLSLDIDMPLPPNILLAVSKGCSSEKAQVIRYLISKGADVSMVTTDALALGPVPFQIDHERGAEWLQILVDAGCDFNWETLLRTAAKNGHIDVLSYCLSQGAPLSPDVLLISAPQTIHYLLGRGLDITYVVAANVDTDLLHRALGSQGEERCLESAKILVDLGWNPSLKNPAGEMPIHIALRWGQLSTVKYLLAQSAPLPSDALLALFEFDGGFFGPGYMSMVHFLIREGVNVNATAPNGDTPLHLALRTRSILDNRSWFDRMEILESWKVVEILLNHGADPSARNADGQTPFHIAEGNGHFFQENFLRLVRNAQRVRSSS